MELIAEYWIKGAIRPNASPECGNHVAARSYSKRFHFQTKCLVLNITRLHIGIANRNLSIIV